MYKTSQACHIGLFGARITFPNGMHLSDQKLPSCPTERQTLNNLFACESLYVRVNAMTLFAHASGYFDTLSS